MPEAAKSDLPLGAAILGAAIVGLLCLWFFGVWGGIVGAIVGGVIGMILANAGGSRS
ncbi:MAG: hypothetical protein AABM67_17940 [Acidobacteriota bacterium]